MIAILGGMGAAACWALATLCSSRSSRAVEPRSVVAWVMLVGLVVTAPAALAEGVPETLRGTVLVWFALVGLGNVGGLVLTYRALRIGQVALVAPLVSTEGAIAAVIALLTGERLAPAVGGALAVVAVGVCAASVPPGARAEAERARHPASVALAVAAALTFGLELYATGRAAAALPSVWVVLAARLFGAVGLALPLLASGRLRAPRGAVWGLVVASGLAEVLGFFSFSLGSRHGLAVAAVLSSQWAVLSVIGAFVLFEERLSRLQLAGVVAVIVGVAALGALRA